MERKYQIFISSTYEDLKEERKMVQDTILSMYHFPIGMEMFSAADEEQWEIIQETIDSSDYYVLIIGHRYGSTIDEGEQAGISYTQKEFRYALKKGIPVLAFLIGDSVSVTPDKMESNSYKKTQLDNFKKEVCTGRMVQWWTSKEDLVNKVMNSLNKQFSRCKRPGWIRAEKINFEDMQTEIVELSKKIRRLEEEKTELERKIVKRMPRFLFQINNGNELQYPYVDIDLVGLNEQIKTEYRKLTYDEVKKYGISEREIQEYNDLLPTEEQLKKYIREYVQYFNLKHNAIPFKLLYKNVGNQKANDVHIKVEFPDDLCIIKEKVYDDNKSPNKPHKPENPIIKKTMLPAALTKAASIGTSFYQMNALGKPLLASVPLDNCTVNINYRENIEDNVLNIWDRNLMHTDENHSHNYFLIPKRKGKFTIAVSAICEEFSEAVVEEFEFLIV